MSHTDNDPLEHPPVLRQLDEQGVLRLTLNRPRRRNALSEAMMAELTSGIAEAGENSDVRVVILDALGPAFCAGHDLKEITAHRTGPDEGRAYFTDIMRRCSTLMQDIVACPKPVIAQVHATATAAGCQLVATCDLAIAADTACFATPGVHIGLFCSTPMVALSRNVSAKYAMEMLLTGEAIDANQAARIGLINRCVPAGELDAAVRALANKIAAKPQATLKFGKEAFYRQSAMELAQAYDYCARVMVDNLLHREAREGIATFLNKKKS